MKFAKVINGVIEGYVDYPSQPECKLIDGKPTIRPVVELAVPAYDYLTQTVVKQETILADRVEISWNVVALPTDQANLNIENDAKAKLVDLDLKSIRPLREYIAAKPDAPSYLKDYETQAQTQRARIPPKP